MGYRDLLKSVVNDAITSMIGDLSSTATFNSITYGDYNPIEGAAEKIEVVYTCQCLLTKLKQSDLIVDLADHERNINGITTAGMKLLVPTLQLEGVDVNSLTDEVIVDGVSYHVLSAVKDPSGALYTFIVGAIGGRPKFGGV